MKIKKPTAFLWYLRIVLKDPKRIFDLIIPMHWSLSICVKMFFCLFDKCCNTSFMASLSLRGCQICKYKSLLCLRGEIVFYIMQIQRTSMSICMQWARQTFSTKDLENIFPLTSFKHHSSGGNRIFSSQGQA